MRIFTDFYYHSHRFLIATALQLIWEFAAQNSQTSRNVIANSQCIRKLFSRRSCDIHTNVARTSHDVRAIELRFCEVIESTLRHSHDVRTNVAFCSQFFRNKIVRDRVGTTLRPLRIDCAALRCYATTVGLLCDKLVARNFLTCQKLLRRFANLCASLRMTVPLGD